MCHFRLDLRSTHSETVSPLKFDATHLASSLGSPSLGIPVYQGPAPAVYQVILIWV